MQYVFLAAMCFFAGIFAATKHRSSLTHRLFFKTAASVMFVLIAVAARVGADKIYYTLVLVGLCFCLIGDVLLVFTELRDKYLVIGAVSFALAHVMYVVAFSVKAGFAYMDIAVFAVLAAIGAAALFQKSAKLGKLRLPAMAYALILCAMTAKALTLPFFAEGKLVFMVFAAVGGVLFAVSDLLLALAKFSAKRKVMLGVMNTITYFSGQALIALSVMM